MEFGWFDLPCSKFIFFGGNLATLDSLKNGRFAFPRGSCRFSQAVYHGVSYRSQETIGTISLFPAWKRYFGRSFLIFQWFARSKAAVASCAIGESSAQMPSLRRQLECNSGLSAGSVAAE